MTDAEIIEEKNRYNDGTPCRRYIDEAVDFKAAIIDLANHPERLDTLTSYLTCHFGAWLEKWANTPEGLASEITLFAKMEV